MRVKDIEVPRSSASYRFEVLPPRTNPERQRIEPTITTPSTKTRSQGMERVVKNQPSSSPSISANVWFIDSIASSSDGK